MSVSRHLADCATCRILAERALPPIKAATLELTRGATPLDAVGDHRPDLARGQVWRVRWDDITRAAMVWSYENDWLSMIPVTPDLAYADDSTVMAAPFGDHA